MARCLFPYSVKNPRAHLPNEFRYIPVPCGKCPYCLKNRVNGWAFRLEKQMRDAENCYFVTLTYETTPKTKNCLSTLDYVDVQRFLKRLRQIQIRRGYKEKVSYYCACEYGSSRQRPHYHLIMFNVLPDCITDAVYESYTRDGVPIGYVNPQTGARLGYVDIQKPKGGAVRYTLKYIAKDKRIPMFLGDDRVKEKSAMSKALGFSYLTDDMIAYHKADISRQYVTLPDGFKAPLPRYYKNKIYGDIDLTSRNNEIYRIEAEKETEREQDFINKFGSLDGYHKAKLEAKQQLCKKFFNEKRKDI